MKKPKMFVLYSAILIVVAIIIWLILAFVNKWDILSFFASSNAIAMYLVIIAWATFCGYILLKDKDKL